jgi:alpha-amylase
MSTICLYFQVHQPFRIRRFSYFDAERNLGYFDNKANKEHFLRIAENCYLPTNKLILSLIKKHSEAFKVTYSISGTALRQLADYAPEILLSFSELAHTGCVEFLAETSHHSLASLFDFREFELQVRQQQQLVSSLLNYNPTVFRNTELISNNQIAEQAYALGFKGILCEGTDKLLGAQSPNQLYAHPKCRIKLLTRNYTLSDDIAFRFSDNSWAQFPLTADKFVQRLVAEKDNSVDKENDVINIGLDYETFGEHQKAATGIFNFLSYLPGAILASGDFTFSTPSEVITLNQKAVILDQSQTTSWADTSKDLNAWLGNDLQKKAAEKLYNLLPLINRIDDQNITEAWRRLSTSDHFYYMSTAASAATNSDSQVHCHFRPFETPYDAFINYMNVLKSFEASLRILGDIYNSKEIVEDVSTSVRNLTPTVLYSNDKTIETQNS